MQGDPNLALLLLGAGYVGICWEIASLRHYLPGILGSGLFVLGAYGLSKAWLGPARVEIVPALAFAIPLMMLALTTYLAFIAVRAFRNKWRNLSEPDSGFESLPQDECRWANATGWDIPDSVAGQTRARAKGRPSADETS